MTSPLRVANCSGFYGDRLSALREQLDGGDVDVITGDYLAELTMLILGMDTLRDAELGYARTFLRQLEDTLGTALERGVRIVTNAGGLTPAGLAGKVRELAKGLGLDPKVSHVEGDDLRPLGLFENALVKIDDVAGEVRVVLENAPRQRMVSVADAEEPSEGHDSIGDLT